MVFLYTNYTLHFLSSNKQPVAVAVTTAAAAVTVSNTIIKPVAVLSSGSFRRRRVSEAGVTQPLTERE